ncbi:MAG: CDP-alcohol phosphatidyltransferase family protein [Clostridia bacterium]|nr:CDP-alcohol phosphatidyltransferase family protein [Clostridia bacterium]
MKRKNLNIPNIITSLRIVGTVLMLPAESMSAWFFVLYSFTGLTDVLDGFIARKTNTTTPLGTKLDSVADLLFYAAMFYKIFPTLSEVLPLGVWIGIGIAVLIRLCAYATAAIKYKRFASLHSWLNKVTGFMVFGLPYMIVTPFAVAYSYLGCAVAIFASASEFVLHLRAGSYDEKTKTIFDHKKAQKQL